MKNTRLKAIKEPFPVASQASIEQWDQYLKSLETPRREVLLKPKHYDRLADEQTIKCTYENLEYRESQYDLAERVAEAMTTLTNRERLVIKLLYWRNFRKSEIAKKMEVPRQSVQTLEKRALEKLKKSLSENDEQLLILTLVQGVAG